MGHSEFWMEFWPWLKQEIRIGIPAKKVQQIILKLCNIYLKFKVYSNQLEIQYEEAVKLLSKGLNLVI